MGSKMRIFHDLEDLQEGEEVILTLQDRPILDDLGNLNEEDEAGVLVNQAIFEKQKAEHNAYIRTNAKKLASVQTAHLDEKFGDIDRKTLLPHYEERKFEKSGITLNEEGQFDVDQMQQLDLIKQKLRSKKTKMETLESLNDNQVASEYKVTTSKPVAAPVFKKKKKKENPNKSESNDLLDFLESNAENEGVEDTFQNRKKLKTEKRENELKEQLIQQKVKRDNYEKAVANTSEELLQSQQRRQEVEADEEAEDAQKESSNKKSMKDIFGEEDDDLLQLSIERARVQQLRKQEEKAELKSNDDRLKSLLDETVQQMEEDQREQESSKTQKQFAAPISKSKLKNTMNSSNAVDVSEINFSEDSLKFIETDENRKKEQDFVYKSETKKQLKDTEKGTTSVVNVSMPTERLRGKRYHDQVKEEEEFQKKLQEDNMTEEEYQQIVTELEEIGLHKETLGSGLSGFLKELEERGVLMHDNLDYSGRNLDKKPHQDGTLTRDADRIQLEYRDDSGKVMTKQQAFRYLCWKFHGQGPSRNKMEKIKMKELEKEKQRVKLLNEDSIIMKNLKQQQKITNQPYFVLQKKN